MAANMPIDYSALALFQRTLQVQQQQQQLFTDGVATAGNGQAGVDFAADEAALNNQAIKFAFQFPFLK